MRLTPIAVLAAAAALVVPSLLGIVEGSATSDRRQCQGESVTILGTARHDRLHGTDGRDVILGGAADDRIFGREGNDLICGGTGDDFLWGNRGSEGGKAHKPALIFGGRGRDEISGNGGNDHLFGGPRGDSIEGGADFDRCDGGRPPQDFIPPGERSDVAYCERTKSAASGSDVVP